MPSSDKGITIPEFESEAQESRWWDGHQDLVEENLVAAMRDGAAQRGARTQVTRSTTDLRLYGL